ncbi:unnamed protein product [Tuber aestivum]|uniref:Chitin-binding type-4 domain-containing protein n=1 Tax=Tuber aestivum TaxID=59557 RepID=A0A292PTW0_9PEZI|nr:unnamed protein product [Tuber aestivum]
MAARGCRRSSAQRRQLSNRHLIRRRTHLQSVKPFIGDCPHGAVENTLYTTEQTFDFPVPSISHRGSGLFAWTWFTVTGFRQTYMNCAHVEIVGGGGGGGWPTGASDMFIGEINQCKTREFGNLYFPDPGSVVQFGGKRNWVNAGPIVVCSIPPQVLPSALMPRRKARMARMLNRGVELVNRAFGGGVWDAGRRRGCTSILDLIEGLLIGGLL